MNDWRTHGACRTEPTNLFFPPSTHDGTGFDKQQQQQQQQQAMAVCAQCPVLLECRAWAIAHEIYGVWGGMSERERKRHRRRHRIPVNQPAIDDDSWKKPRAAYLWRQGWKITDIVIELRTNARQVQRWFDAEGIDAYPPPDGRAPRRRHEEQVRVREPRTA